jgi:hypothetical protein
MGSAGPNLFRRPGMLQRGPVPVKTSPLAIFATGACGNEAGWARSPFQFTAAEIGASPGDCARTDRSPIGVPATGSGRNDGTRGNAWDRSPGHHRAELAGYEPAHPHLLKHLVHAAARAEGGGHLAMGLQGPALDELLGLVDVAGGLRPSAQPSSIRLGHSAHPHLMLIHRQRKGRWESSVVHRGPRSVTGREAGHGGCHWSPYSPAARGRGFSGNEVTRSEGNDSRRDGSAAREASWTLNAARARLERGR